MAPSRRRDGFNRASSIERLPVDRALVEQVARFKAIDAAELRQMCQVSCAVPYASSRRSGAPLRSLIDAEYSLLALKKSLFHRVGNLARKTLETQGKFGTKIVPDGRFCENSLLNSLLAGNLTGILSCDRSEAKPR
jgi:hypothetical protein